MPRVSNFAGASSFAVWRRSQEAVEPRGLVPSLAPIELDAQKHNYCFFASHSGDGNRRPATFAGFLDVDHTPHKGLHYRQVALAAGNPSMYVLYCWSFPAPLHAEATQPHTRDCCTWPRAECSRSSIALPSSAFLAPCPGSRGQTARSKNDNP